MKLEGKTDERIAEKLRVSRQTIVARKQQIYEVLQEELADLHGTIQESVVAQVTLRLSRRGADDA